jgi:hypothetical protein
MVVQRGHREPVVQQRRHDGIHLVFGQHEVAHHHVVSFRSVRQCHPAAEPERGRRGASLDRDLQIVARDVDLEHAVLEVAGLAERGEHGGVVGGHGLRARRERERYEHCDERKNAHG